MSCLGLRLLRLANQSKGDHSYKKTPYLSSITKHRGLSSWIQRTSIVLAFPSHLSKSHKVFQQKGRLCWKGLIFPGHTIWKMAFFGCVISSLEKSPNSIRTQPKQEETYLGLLLPASQCVGVWGRIPQLPPHPRTWKGHGRTGHRVPEAGNQPLPMLGAHSHVESLQNVTLLRVRYLGCQYMAFGNN